MTPQYALVKGDDDLESRVAAESRSFPSHGAKTPLWCCAALALSVIAISGAATVYRKAGDVPPLTLPAWRQQLTAALLAPGAALQWRTMPAEDRTRALIKDWRWSAVGGTALALHCAFWVSSLQATSLPHALLLVSTTPVLLVLLALARRDAVSAGEAGGALLAVAGGALMSAGASGTGENEVSMIGDLASLAASSAFVLYLHAGKTLRSYQPIFVYAFPVTAFAALLLTAAGFLLEGRSLVGLDRHGVFGWLASAHYAPYVAYLGVCGGIIGHTGVNAVLKHMSSLSVALVMNLEPVLGPVIGWAFGEVAPPGVFTWLGGAVVLVATAVVIVATSRREQQEAAAQSQLIAECKGGAMPQPCPPLPQQVQQQHQQLQGTHHAQSGKRDKQLALESGEQQQPVHVASLFVAQPAGGCVGACDQDKAPVHPSLPVASPWVGLRQRPVTPPVPSPPSVLRLVQLGVVAHS